MFEQLNGEIGKLNGGLEKEIQQNVQLKDEVWELKGGLEKEIQRNKEIEVITMCCKVHLYPLKLLNPEIFNSCLCDLV